MELLYYYAFVAFYTAMVKTCKFAMAVNALINIWLATKCEKSTNTIEKHIFTTINLRANIWNEIGTISEERK